MSLKLDPPFGTFALTSEQEVWRQKSNVQPDSRWGRWMISRARKKALTGTAEPVDVEIVTGLKARLYPSGNRCEKRAFAGIQYWDAAERAALEQAVEQSGPEGFVFLDVGANVGLYSLFAAHFCREQQKAGTILSIEPGLETCRRLEENVAANGFDIQIVRAAISDVPGSGFLAGGEDNRGEARLMEQASGGEPVVIDTLARICRVSGLTHINAMKLDIEGHDLVALKGFFDDAPNRLYPDLLIVETGKTENSPIVDLCREHNYMVTERSGLNTLLGKPSHV